MERLFEISGRLISNVPTKHYRYLYNLIDWNDNLIMLKGARGVGKTTILYQRCALSGGKGVYVSLDQLWFNEHTIVDLADYHYKHGGKELYLDEVHRYPRANWQQEIKNIHDSYPGYKIVFTGSSVLQLNSKIADLSRRVVEYELSGLSFREYLAFKEVLKIEPIPFSEILKNHSLIASEISSKITVLNEFESYLKKGFYPFFLNTSEFSYYQRIEKIIQTVIDADIPAVFNIEYETQLKLKKLLVILSEEVPFIPNMTKLSKDVAVTRNQLMKLFTLLNEAEILRILNNSSTNPKAAAKPDKILFDNPSIINAICTDEKIGTIRESFAASMLNHVGKLYSAEKGDIEIDKKYIFEIGGKRKGYSQIADIPDSYILADDITSGFGNKIPLWLLGFIY